MREREKKTQFYILLVSINQPCRRYPAGIAKIFSSTAQNEFEFSLIVDTPSTALSIP
jgi:hypothetical protein